MAFSLSRFRSRLICLTEVALLEYSCRPNELTNSTESESIYFYITHTSIDPGGHLGTNLLYISLCCCYCCFFLRSLMCVAFHCIRFYLIYSITVHKLTDCNVNHSDEIVFASGLHMCTQYEPSVGSNLSEALEMNDERKSKTINIPRIRSMCMTTKKNPPQHKIENKIKRKKNVNSNWCLFKSKHFSNRLI